MFKKQEKEMNLKYFQNNLFHMMMIHQILKKDNVNHYPIVYNLQKVNLQYILNYQKLKKKNMKQKMKEKNIENKKDYLQKHLENHQ